MQTALEEGPLKEAAILTRAVENVFRKLIRLLIGRMSLTRLQEMFRIVFVEEAEFKLQQEDPGKKVAMTKMALLTGLDTRTLSKINQERKLGLPLHKKDRFLRELTPEGTVLDYWKSNIKYLDKTSLEPLDLDLRNGLVSFENLVKEILPSRGVTTSSILKNLIYSKSVQFDPETEKVKLLSGTYMPFEFSAATAQLEIGLATVGNLMETLAHNFETKNHSRDAFFQRASWSLRINEKDALKIRSEIRNSLTKAEEKAVNILESFEENKIHENQITAGVGLFYFEENPASR